MPLDRPWERGEVMAIETERTLKNSFDHESTEWVQVKIVYPTVRCSLHVVWPPNRPPTYLKLSRASGAPSVPTVIPLAVLKDAGDRKVLEAYAVAQPEVGEVITLTWQWGLSERQTQPSASVAVPA